MAVSSPSPQKLRDLCFSFNRWGCSPVWPQGHRLSLEWFQHVLTDFTFWFFFRGSGELHDFTTRKRYILKPGVCLCMFPGRKLEVTQDDKNPLGNMFFHFDIFQGAKKLPPNTWPYTPFYVEATRIGFTDQMLRRVLVLLNKRYLTAQSNTVQKQADLEAEFILKGLLMELGTDAPPFGIAEEKHFSTERHHEKVVTTLIGELFSNPVKFRDVSEMTRVSGYGASHFRSLCLKFYGKSPQDVLIMARIEKAKDYLLRSEFTISTIADMLGYQNIHYFSRQFHEVVGMTPSEYRRSG